MIDYFQYLKVATTEAEQNGMTLDRTPAPLRSYPNARLQLNLPKPRGVSAIHSVDSGDTASTYRILEPYHAGVQVPVYLYHLRNPSVLVGWNEGFGGVIS